VSAIDVLLRKYEELARLPWTPGEAGPRRVWFVVYDPPQERRLRFRLHDFEEATRNAGRRWKAVDLTDRFARWMAKHEYREAYFEQPEDMELALEDFADWLAEYLTGELSAPDVDDTTIVAVYGLTSLFGLARASVLFDRATPAIRGRMAVFFPGQYERNMYRLLDARDGWNYHAIPITAAEGD
jgi:hypothetical protein